MWSENKVYYTYILVNLLCFLIVVCLGEMFHVSLRICILHLSDKIVFSCSLQQMVLLNSSLPFNEFSTTGCICFWVANHFCEREIEVTSYNSGFIYLSVKFYQCLPHVFWHSVLRHITQVSCITGRFFTIWATREAHLHINNHDISLEKLFLYHYIIALCFW